jgi:hypothetical protein
MKRWERGVLFGEDDMAGDVEAGLAPRSHEQVHLVPGIKADAKLPVFEKPVHLRESGFKPGVIVVVHHAAPAAVVVIHQIGRVGQNEIDSGRHNFLKIDTSELIGLRDRALLGLMDYTFARVSAVVMLRVQDYIFSRVAGPG